MTVTATEPTAIRIGEPVNGESASLADIGQTRRDLFTALVDAKRAFGGKTVILEDAQRQPLTYSRLVIGARALGRKLTARTKRRERIGLLLPSVQATAVTFFGLHAFARVPAMLNFTAGATNLKAACEIAAISTIVTSRKFVDEGKLDEPLEAIAQGREVIYLETCATESPASTRRGRGSREPVAARWRGATGSRPTMKGRDSPLPAPFRGQARRRLCSRHSQSFPANGGQVMQHGRRRARSQTTFSSIPSVFHSSA